MTGLTNRETYDALNWALKDGNSKSGHMRLISPDNVYCCKYCEGDRRHSLIDFQHTDSCPLSNALRVLSLLEAKEEQL